MFIFALTPIVAASLPALVPLITAAAGGLGYKVVSGLKEGGDINEALRQKLQETNSITLRVDELVMDSMQQEVARAESLYLQKGSITLAIIKDERNKLRIEVTGPEGIDKKLLEQEGRAFAGELAQLFAQNRIVQELQRMNAEVVEEEQMENGEIRLKIHRWT